MVLMQKHIIQESTLRNELVPNKNTRFQINPRIQFAVLKKAPEQPTTVCDLSVEIGSMDDDSPLYIKVRMRGVFVSVAQDASGALLEPAEFNTQAFPILFEATRAYISGMMLMGGLTPINLPPIDPNKINFQGN